MDSIPRRRPGAGTVLSTFFYMWIMVGMILGTAVLVGPIRMITEGLGRAGWEQNSQDRLLMVVILLFIVVSLLLTRMIVGAMFRSRNRTTRFIVAGAMTLAAVFTARLWANPAKMLAGIAGGGTGGTFNVAGGAEFIFGAYPDAPRLIELKGEGVNNVISLQHPGVVIELEGINAEKNETAKLGMTFIQAPMLPWVSDNEASLEKLRQIARTGKGKYYVHCGLGRDRVNVAKRIIESEGKKVALGKDVKTATGFSDRPIPFERGSLAHLDNGKWLIPYPNKHEMFGFVLSGQAGHVVSLLDTADPQQKAWSDSMAVLMMRYSLPYSMLALPANELARATTIAATVRAMKSRVTVIAPATPMEDGKPRPRAEAAVAFIKAYGMIAPESFAARPSWQLNKAAKGGLDTLAGTADPVGRNR